MTNASTYSARRAVFPADKFAVMELWRGNLGDPARCAEKFSWFYENSPTGEPLTMLLSCGSAADPATALPVGVAAAGPRSFLIGANAAAAGVLVDLTVAAQHRTLFPALVLQKAVLQAGLIAGPLLYGFPNPKAAPVFQRVGYRKLGTLTRYVRVLRSRQYLDKYLPSIAATVAGIFVDLPLRARLLLGAGRRSNLIMQWLDLQLARVDPQTMATEDTIELIRGARNAAFLQWRFADTDKHKFKFISIDGRADNSQLGWWIVAPADDVLHVYDSSASLLQGRYAGDAWIKLVSDAYARGFRSLSFECLGPDSFVATLRQAGLTPRSERPVFGAVREDHVATTRSATWFLTAADEDE